MLLADERAIRLRRDGRSLQEAGIAEPLLRPAARSRARPASIAPTVTLCSSLQPHTTLRLQLEGDQDARPFDLWKDGRRELGQLAATN